MAKKSDRVTFVDGWSGGHYCWGGKRVNFSTISKEINKGEYVLVIAGTEYDPLVRMKYGVDCDMGNNYHWKRSQLCAITKNALLNKIAIPVEQVMSETRIKNVYLVKKKK